LLTTLIFAFVWITGNPKAEATLQRQ